MKIHLLLSIVTALLSVIASAQSPPDVAVEALTGSPWTWIRTDKHTTGVVTFDSNGSVTQDTPGNKWSGTWAKIGPSTVVITHDKRFKWTLQFTADWKSFAGSCNIGPGQVKGNRTKPLPDSDPTPPRVNATPSSASSSPEPVAPLVGTWRKKDKSWVEARANGEIIAKDKVIGRWQPWPQSGTPELFLVRFVGDVGKYKTSLQHYQRRWVIEHPGNGLETILERVDNGPTKNPDVPDEHTALRLEEKDLSAQVADLQLRLPKVQAEAAAKWQMHWSARAMGRISTHNIKAKELDAAAESMARALIDLQARLVEVQRKL